VVRFLAVRFGPYLKRVRLGAGLTQLELAKKCGLSSAYVTQLETGRIEPPTRKVCYCLARALGLHGDEVWKQAFIARAERWLKKEGFKGLSPEAVSNFFDVLNSRQ
jgi:transcriptional regulator with XRE-family HTH domain